MGLCATGPEPKARWWAYIICMPLPSIVRQYFQISSPLKALSRLKLNFTWSLLGMGERKFVQMVLIKWSIWPPCPYMVKTLKIVFSATKRPMILKLSIQYQVLEFYQVCSNDNPGLTWTYFTARSNLVSYPFVRENGITMDYSETIVGYDIKVGWCS